jgi:hypothetical protein
MVGRALALALAAAATIAPAAHASAPAALTPVGLAPAAVPPDLQALEQKMLALQPTSERVSATISIAEKPKVKGPVGGFNHIFGHASSILTPLITVAGEFSIGPPPAANVTVSFLGIPVSTRLIGSTLYTHEPDLSRLDGGRPWVEERNTSLAKALGSLGSQSNGPGGSVGEPGTGFASLAKLIAHAQGIAELGPASVDGVPVTRFKLAVPIASLQKPAHSRRARARARRERKLFAPLLRVELFLAETGLPVRTSVVLVARHDRGELIEQSDITAINVPVLVQAPPAAETITATELKRVMRRRARRLADRRRAGGRRIHVVHRGSARNQQK